MWKIHSFFFSSIVKTKICIIERLLSGSLLFRNDCIHYERSCACVCVCSLAQLLGLADWLPLWLCLCWSNVRAQLTIIDVSFNGKCVKAFCVRALWCYLDKTVTTVNKRWCVELAGVGCCRWSAPTWKSSGCLCFVWSHGQVWVWNSISFYNV